ncbi:MAG TPA: haloacid dehalogenase-like hydrolase [Micromonosporaceae bacterium]|jgi:phosphoglycolate phosphatase-like HAD superfamily hydrolase
MLVLWDIDHTLIDGGAVSRLAYATAFQRVAGRPMDVPWLFNGRTELAAATEVMRAHGVEPEPALIATFMELLVAEYRDRFDDLAAHGRVLPGVVDALAAVGTMAQVHQSVLTGNLYELAVLKLTALGLAERVDFRIGAYGGDAYERTDLPVHAFDRTERFLGRRYVGADTVIIGDTVRDIVTARAVGARAVGVATGRTTSAELAAAGADVVLADLADTTRVLRAIVPDQPIG